ncbi:MAG: ArnT family glycosyltransferase, partial [bacterium]
MRKSSIPLRADSRKDDRGRSGKDYLIVGIILFLYLLLALLVFDPRLHTGGDNAHYICLARSILSGKGYREIYKPGEPPHTLYPFGYPLLLAPVISLFKSSFVALKILSLLFGACSVLLVYMLLENRCGRLCLYAVVGLFAVSPLLLEYSHYVLSDSSFTFFSLLSLFLFRRAELDLRRFPPLLWASVVCAVFTYYIRPIGASLFLGVLLYFVVRKQLKKVMFALAIVVILVLPWSVRNARVPGGSGYFAPFILKNPYDLESGTISTKDFRQRLKSNSEAYLLINFPKTVFSMHKKLWPGAKRRWDMYSFGVLLSGVMLLGFIRELRQRLELPH